MSETLALLCFAAAWLVPNHYPPWTSFQGEFVACFGALLLGGAVLRYKLRATVPLVAMAGFASAAIPLIQLCFGEVLFHADAVLSAGYVAGWALSISAAATLIRRDGAFFMDGLTACLVFASVASTGIALSQWLDVGKNLFANEIIPGNRPYGNLAQPNHLATLQMLGLVALIRWYDVRRVSRPVLIIGFTWLAFGMVMTQARVAWAAIVVLGAWFAWNARRSALRLTPATVGSGIALFGAGVIAWKPLNDLLLISSATTLGERIKPGMRLVHWQTLWDALWASPWTGYGWQQVSMAQRSGADAHPSTGELLFNSHNIALDLLLWNGVPLGALLLLTLAWWLVRQLRLCRSADQCMLIAGVAAIAIHGMVEYPLSYAYFLLPAGLMMGALEGIEPSGALRVFPCRVFAAPWALSGALLVWTGYEYVQVEESARTARLVAAGIGTDKVSYAPPPDVYLLDNQREFIRLVGTPAAPNMSEAQIDWMRRVTSRFTYASAMYRFALAAALNGHGDEAKRVLHTMCKIHGPERCEEGREGWIAPQH